MPDTTAALALTRIRRGQIDLVLQPNTRDLWRLPHIETPQGVRPDHAIMEWLAAATPFTQFAKLAEIGDVLAPERIVYLIQAHDADLPALPEPQAWFNLQELPPLAFLNEKRLFDDCTRRITEIVIAHQNPYRVVPGFR